MVSGAVAAWIQAAQGEGVLACAKHYPGHGRTRRDSHQALPTVDLSLKELEATDLRPFRAAIEAGVAAVMTGHVAYPAWDPSGVPATRSATILGHLRTTLGFDGLVVTDALIMKGAQAELEEAEAVLAAFSAGCDVLLYPPNLAATVAALCRAAEDNKGVARRVEESVARYERALARAVAAPSSVAPDLSGVTADAIADALLTQGLLRGSMPSLEGGVDLVVVDDDQGGWYAPGPNDLVRRSLARQGIGERYAGHRVILAFAEPRAAKGRAGFGPESRERLQALVPGAALVVVFGHPRLAAEIPGDGPLLLAWHRQPLMQEAVARLLGRAVRGAVVSRGRA